jgi:hypothetical protein
MSEEVISNVDDSQMNLTVVEPTSIFTPFLNKEENSVSNDVALEGHSQVNIEAIKNDQKEIGVNGEAQQENKLESAEESSRGLNEQPLDPANVFTPFLNKEANAAPEGHYSEPQAILEAVKDEQNNNSIKNQEEENKSSTEEHHLDLEEFSNIVNEIDEEIHDPVLIQQHSPILEHPPEEIKWDQADDHPQDGLIDEIHDEEGEFSANEDEHSLNSTEGKKKKAKHKKKKVKGTDHSKLSRGASRGAGLLDLAKSNQPQQPQHHQNHHNNRPKSKANNNISPEELAALPMQVYHSELVEGKYDRSVIVSMLVPEKYIKIHSRDGSAPSSPKGLSPKSHMKRQTTMDPQYQHEFSMEDFVSASHSSDGPQPFPSQSYEMGDFQNDDHSINSNNNNNRPQSASSIHNNMYHKLVPNKRMKYFIIKVNDLVTSRDASYTIILRDFHTLLTELIKEYETPDVQEFFQPFLLSWWKANLPKIILIYDKPNGSLSIVVDKKSIRKMIKKKMDHYFWMKQNLTSSYQDYENYQKSTLHVITHVSTNMKHGENGEKKIRNSFDESNDTWNESTLPVESQYDSSQENEGTVHQLATKKKKGDGIPLRKSVEFSVADIPAEIVNATDFNNTDSAKRRNSRTILKQSQSKSEKSILLKDATTDPALTVDINAYQSYDFADNNEQGIQNAENPESPSKPKLGQTRLSGISKSMPNFASGSAESMSPTNKNAAAKKSAPQNDDDQSLANKLKQQREKERLHAIAMKNYNRPTNPKTNELLMVAYGRPKDYQPPPKEEVKPPEPEVKHHKRQSMTRSSLTDRSTTKANKKSSMNANPMLSKSVPNELGLGKEKKEEPLGIDTSDLVISPYEGKKKSKRGSSGSPSPGKPRKDEIPSSPVTKLPSITSNTNQGNSKPYSPKNVFRISNPYSFALNELYGNTHGNNHNVTDQQSKPPSLSSRPQSAHHSPVTLPPLKNPSVSSSPVIETPLQQWSPSHGNNSRPLSPHSPQEIAAKLYYETNYQSDDLGSLLDASSYNEESLASSLGENTKPNPLPHQMPPPGFQKLDTFDSRAMTPFESETVTLRGSARLAADIIKKARRQVSGDIKFQVRKVSYSEMKLLNR